MNQKEKKKQTGIVGSPQNVCHLMVGKGGEGGGREGGTEEKRMWFRKYKSKGRVTEFGMKKEEVLCDKKSAQMQMALSCISHEDEGFINLTCFFFFFFFFFLFFVFLFFVLTFPFFSFFSF